jgi:hypothetical protein
MILTACGSQQSVVQEAATVPIISTQIFMNNPRGHGLVCHSKQT